MTRARHDAALSQEATRASDEHQLGRKRGMGKHTPGLWIQFLDRSADTVTIMPAGRRGDIATVKLSSKNGDANARLIAAAPELLEWTKLLERSLVYEIKKSEVAGDDEGARLKSFTLAQVRAAIAKAEQ